MKVGSRVVKIGIPGIHGTVVSIDGAGVRVAWSKHFSQLESPRKLIKVAQTNDEIHAPQTKGKVSPWKN
jgi:preprotein translocase subunit YajC